MTQGEKIPPQKNRRGHVLSGCVVARREGLKYVNHLAHCPFAIFLCLGKLTKKVKSLPQGTKKTMYCHGIRNNNKRERTFF